MARWPPEEMTSDPSCQRSGGSRGDAIGTALRIHTKVASAWIWSFLVAVWTGFIETLHDAVKLLVLWALNKGVVLTHYMQICVFHMRSSDIDSIQAHKKWIVELYRNGRGTWGYSDKLNCKNDSKRRTISVCQPICRVVLILLWNNKWLKLWLPREQISWGQHGLIRVLSAPDRPHVGPMNLAIRVFECERQWLVSCEILYE